jgi:hypothetical protein
MAQAHYWEAERFISRDGLLVARADLDGVQHISGCETAGEAVICATGHTRSTTEERF